jgi:hypothetical protein
MQDVVHSVRTHSIWLERSPFGFRRFPIGFTADRFKKVTYFIPIHFNDDRF